MMFYNSLWQTHPGAVEDYLRQIFPGKMTVGGRFVFDDEAQQDRMLSVLQSEGLELIDTGQFQVVGAIQTEPTTPSIATACTEFVSVAQRHDIRLISIEAGDIEAGDAYVLAAEADYIPWWRVAEIKRS